MGPFSTVLGLQHIGILTGFARTQKCIVIERGKVSVALHTNNGVVYIKTEKLPKIWRSLCLLITVDASKKDRRRCGTFHLPNPSRFDKQNCVLYLKHHTKYFTYIPQKHPRISYLVCTYCLAVDRTTQHQF